MKLDIVSIQRDRGRWMTEWFAFHYLMGFRHYYFYAHLCVDESHSVLQRLSKKLDITATALPQRVDGIQLSAYQHACDHHLNNVDWMAFIDGDEFLFPTQSYTMQDALLPYNSMATSAVAAFNVNFGSNGYLTEPDGLITENFRRCANHDFLAHRRVKSIIKGGQLVSVSACSNVFNTPLGTIDEHGNPVTWGYMPDRIPTYDVFRFNHYPCQSLEYFNNFKRNSGHADAGANNVRPDEWWTNFDTNQVLDDSLIRFNADLKRVIAWLEAS